MIFVYVNDHDAPASFEDMDSAEDFAQDIESYGHRADLVYLP